MKLSFLSYTCRVKILPLILFLCLLTLLLRLGFWQLSRADMKREFLLTQQAKMHKEQVPLVKLLAEHQDLRYRRVELTGHYDVSRQLLIDNQMYNGVVGYFVLTPFILDLDNTLVLVNRGWVRMDKDRRRLPDIDFMPPAGGLSIVGVINDFPGVGLALKGADEPTEGWPSVVQIINAQKIGEKLNQEILEFQVQLSPDQMYGYTRDWQLKTRMPPEKHVAYAFQWFALAVTLILLILWMSCRTQKND